MFSWNVIWFLQKESTTVKNFRLSTAQVKFHQNCWEYIKFQLKKSMEELCLMTPNNCAKFEETLFFFSKMTRLWWILIWAIKSLKNLHFGPFYAKYFEEKLTCALENYMRNLANFHHKNWKCQNWYFHGILLPKAENVWAANLQRSYK